MLKINKIPKNDKLQKKFNNTDQLTGKEVANLVQTMKKENVTFLEFQTDNLPQEKK